MIVRTVNDTSWDAKITNGIQFVTFTSPHCPMCNVIGPELDRVAIFFPTISFFTCDITQSPDTKNYYGVDGTPRSILFIDGVEHATLRGFQYTDGFSEFITQHTGIQPLSINIR